MEQWSTILIRIIKDYREDQTAFVKINRTNWKWKHSDRRQASKGLKIASREIMDPKLAIKNLAGKFKLTRKAIFFNLFIAENCLMRDRTAVSRGRSGATPWSRTHGWHRTSCADKRSAGRGLSILVIRSFALSEITGQGSESKSMTPFSTASNIPCCVSALYYIEKISLYSSEESSPELTGG
jgi:hypothetical protein